MIYTFRSSKASEEYAEKICSLVVKETYFRTWREEVMTSAGLSDSPPPEQDLLFDTDDLQHLFWLIGDYLNSEFDKDFLEDSPLLTDRKPARFKKILLEKEMLAQKLADNLIKKTPFSPEAASIFTAIQIIESHVKVHHAKLLAQEWLKEVLTWYC